MKRYVSLVLTTQCTHLDIFLECTQFVGLTKAQYFDFYDSFNDSWSYTNISSKTHILVRVNFLFLKNKTMELFASKQA
jgi:hypothetical protein